MRARWTGLMLVAFLVTGCGTSAWNWSWVSGDGNTTVDGNFDGTAKGDGAGAPTAFTYPMAPEETAADW